jgi:energy-coupling factor transport system ATP-binding protein
MAEAALPPDMARRRVATLSGGEKQKVALAAALAQGAELLLVDEPTAHLDPAAAAQVHALLAAPDQRRAVLVVDHRLEGLIEAIDRVVVLGADGRLTAEGPPRRLFRRERARLEAMGVWTPAASALDAALIEAGVTLPVPPLGVAEALDGLDAAPPALRERAPPAVRRLCEAERRRGPVRRGPVRRNPVRRGPVVARLRDVDCRTPGGPVALRGASLDVRGGEVLAIVGPNGAGKSTLALALAGLIPPAAGAREGPPGGLVLQNPDLQFVAGSVEEEVAASLPPRERRSGRAAAILGEWGLAPLARRHPLELSEGQKRRLALAAVDAVADWPLLVLDEPTAGLDLAAAWRLEHRVARIAERDRAVALVTHDMDLVARLADRVALVAEGRLVRVDAAEAVLSDAALLRAHRLAAPALTPARAWLRRTGALSC